MKEGGHRNSSCARDVMLSSASPFHKQLTGGVVGWDAAWALLGASASVKVSVSK